MGLAIIFTLRTATLFRRSSGVSTKQRSRFPHVTIWGTRTPLREFLYSDDMADACVFLMNLPDVRFEPLLAADSNHGLPPVVNVGSGEEITVAALSPWYASWWDTREKLHSTAASRMEHPENSCAARDWWNWAGRR